MGPRRPSRFRNTFTIRRRLIAFGLVAVVFAGGASYNSLRALQESGASTDRATDLASIQHYHQDAVNQLTSIQSAVLEIALTGQGTTGRTPEELEVELRSAADAFDHDRDAIAAMDPQAGLRGPLPDVAAAQDRYVRDALTLAALAASEPALVTARLETFMADADELFTELDEITLLIGTQTAKAAGAADAAEKAAARKLVVTAVVGTALIIAITAAVALSIARQLRQLSTIARAMAAGDLRVRNEINSADELGGLARSFDEMADSFEDLVMRLEQEASQDAFRRQLFDAFEMAGDDEDIHTIVEDAMALIGEAPMELLLSDSSKHHVSQLVTHPTAGAPSCPVGSTGQCVAVRRGHRLVFESSDAIDACPHLKRRDTACSAVCVPVTFNGESLGVIHSTGENGVRAESHTVDRLAALAGQTGARLGTIHAFRGAREQATTDGLTGLRNRRTLENDVRALAAGGTDYALIMCDLDRFKNLNDHYGHEMGDRALRLFGQVLTENVREDDIAARLGGEEFVIVQPGMTANDAIATVERIQLSLSARLEIGEGPRFTSSFGISDTTMAPGFNAALRIADAGLLAAKDHGRDRWIVGDPAMASVIAQRGRPRGVSADLVDRTHGPTVLPDRI